MENLKHWQGQFADNSDGYAFWKVLEGVYNRLRSAAFTSAGLVIKAGGSGLVKTGASIWYGMAKGKHLTIAASTDMPALSGTVTNAAFNMYVFTVDDAGTVTSTMGVEGATLAAMKFPSSLKDDDCVIGWVYVNPTGTGNFIGGTTDLDDGTVVPNAVYVSPIGALSLVTPM